MQFSLCLLCCLQSGELETTKYIIFTALFVERSAPMPKNVNISWDVEQNLDLC